MKEIHLQTKKEGIKIKNAAKNIENVSNRNIAAIDETTKTNL